METLGRQEIQNKVKPKTELDLKQNLRISKNPEQNLKPSLHHILEMLLHNHTCHMLYYHKVSFTEQYCWINLPGDHPFSRGLLTLNFCLRVKQLHKRVNICGFARSF